MGGEHIQHRATAVERLAVCAMVIALVVAGAAPFVVGVASASSHEITGCTVITQPGRYTFTADIVDAPASPCIEILSSDVYIDGNGHTLDGTWTGGGTVQRGIAASPTSSLTNITITNLRMTELGAGIVLGAVSDFEISNNVFDSTSTSEVGYGVSVGYFSTPSTDGVIANNELVVLYRGIYVVGPDGGVVIEQNTVTSDSASSTGIVVGQATGVTIDSNEIDGGGSVNSFGLRVAEPTSGSGANVISNNVVSNAAWGLTVGDYAGNAVSTSVVANTVSGSSFADFVVPFGSDPVVVEGLVLDSATVSFEGQNMLLRAVDPAPTPPSGTADIGQFVEAGSYVARDSLLNLIVHYDDADVAGVDESALELYAYDTSEGTWSVVPSSSADAANNRVGPVEVALEQAYYYDDSSEYVDYQSQFAPLAPVGGGTSVDVVQSGGSSAVTVTNAEAGVPVEIPLDESVGTYLTLESITVKTTVDTDYTLDVSTSRAAPSGTPELAIVAPSGTIELGYIDIDESLSESEIDTVVFKFRVASSVLTAIGANPDDIVLYRYASDGTATALPTQNLGLDSSTNEYVFEATSPGLSVFGAAALFPNLYVTDASVDETEILAGESVSVTATVTNDGGAAGDLTADLTVDGAVVDSTVVSLGPGASTSIQFDHLFAEAGTYAIAVNGVDAGTVLVKYPVDIDVQSNDETNTVPPGPNAAVPVSILGTEAFDPTTELDVGTVRFGSESAVSAGGGSEAFNTDVDDVNGDGIDDLVVLFRVGGTDFEAGDSVAVLEGETVDGLTIYGTDAVFVESKGQNEQ